MSAHKAARMKRNHFSNVCNIGFSAAMNGMYLVGFAYCGFGIISGTVSYGTLTAILQLISQIQSPFANITGYLPKFYAMTASADRLREAEDFADDCSDEVEETEVKADDPVVEEKNDEEAERIEAAINKVKEIEAKSKKSKSKLKIVNKVTKIISMDVQGEFGLYHIEDGKVQMGTDIFENIEEVEVWAKEHIDTTEEKIRSLEREISAHKQQIEFLNNSKNEAIEVVENYLTK